VYLIGPSQWIANTDSFLHPEEEDEGLGAFYWSRNCVFCHTTGPAWPPVVTQDDGTMVELAETAVSELGIACEACHGPGNRHVRANHHPVWRYRQHWTDGTHGDAIVHPDKLDAGRSAAVCGRCHSTTAPPSEGQLDGMETFRPGDRFEDHFAPQALTALWHQAVEAEANGHTQLTGPEREVLGSFWPDRTVRVAGREYNGLSQSRCLHEGGLSCLGCHSLHQGTADALLRRNMDPDQPCRTCHTAIAADEGRHTHHNPDSVGSSCLNCHMPYTSYGLLSATRSHRIDSPTASGLASRDRPNACNLCHLDRSVVWTAQQLTAWYGQPFPSDLPDTAELPTAALWMLRGDAAQRAIAAWHASYPGAIDAMDHPRALLPILALLQDEDPYAAVRTIAQNASSRVQTTDPNPSAPPPELLSPAMLIHLYEQRDDRPTWISE
ncbi:MAG: cytochrome c3 family protein, partial [Myxococcota bacterium]